MRQGLRWTLPLCLTVVCEGELFAWQTGQHRNITQQAIAAAKDCPDIQMYAPQIIAWSGGTGGLANAQGPLQDLIFWLHTTTPAEELAHQENQRALLNSVQFFDGGNFSDIVKFKLPSAYKADAWSSEIAGFEGAYVWMGAAVHLIEDQASFPHGANVYHGGGDKFEGPVALTFGNKTSLIDPSQITSFPGLSYFDAYQQCLNTTQANLTSQLTSQSTPYWVMNDDMVNHYHSPSHRTSL